MNKFLNILKTLRFKNTFLMRMGIHHGIVAHVLYFDIIISKFQLQSGYYIRTNNLGKGMNFLIHVPTTAMG